ncbi:metal-dependent hydrolase [bacterium]|nr:metal-dependent hydrolase [bacterium]
MASAFGHGFLAFAFNRVLPNVLRDRKVWLWGMFCAIIPDADVISFSFGIPYESFWGHRGFTHSILFAILLASLITFFFKSKPKVVLWIYFFFCTVSHGILDAMTTGGRGIAFFSPLNNERFFLPFRPIKVSPIGIDRFFGERGLQVIQSEIVWIGIPGLLIIAIAWIFYRKRTTH